MRLALLSGAAALSLIGTAVAQADEVYVSDPGYVAQPGYVYAVPAPPFGPFTPRYVVTQPAYVAQAPAYVAEPSVSYTEPAIVAAPPAVTYAPPALATPHRSPIVTTGSTSGCYVDLAGVERCY